ncbi:MAG: PIN domain-containing protein [Candidatus Anammoxibacter sp.]
MTVAEIVYGAVKSSRTEYHMDNLRNSLIPSVNIVSFDEKAAFVYGQIRADLEKAGKIINHSDLQIAAITISNKYILITGNVRHFKRIPNLRVENWI